MAEYPSGYSFVAVGKSVMDGVGVSVGVRVFVGVSVGVELGV
jgi:hypothetical protein